MKKKNKNEEYEEVRKSKSFLVPIVLFFLLLVFYIGAGFYKYKGIEVNDNSVDVYTVFDENRIISSKNWMSEIKDYRRIGEINIPGVHDAGTDMVELSFFSKCQEGNISELLNAGYRYLDIRLGTDTNKVGPNGTYSALALKHGFTDCKKGPWVWSDTLYLDDVLEDCYQFLEENPTETIIFVVKQEYGEESVAEFQKILHSYINFDSEKWYLKNDPLVTMGDVRGKIVLCRRYEDEAGLGDEESGLPLIWSQQSDTKYVENPYDKKLLNEKKDGKESGSNGVGLGYEIIVQDRYCYTAKDKWTVIQEICDFPAQELAGAKRLVSEANEEIITCRFAISFLSTKGTWPYGHPAYYARSINKKFLEMPLSDNGDYGWIIMDYGTQELAEKVYLTNYKMSLSR